MSLKHAKSNFSSQSVPLAAPVAADVAADVSDGRVADGNVDGPIIVNDAPAAGAEAGDAADESLGRWQPVPIRLMPAGAGSGTLLEEVKRASQSNLPPELFRRIKEHWLDQEYPELSDFVSKANLDKLAVIVSAAKAACPFPQSTCLPGKEAAHNTAVADSIAAREVIYLTIAIDVLERLTAAEAGEMFVSHTEYLDTFDAFKFALDLKQRIAMAAANNARLKASVSPAMYTTMLDIADPRHEINDPALQDKLAVARKALKWRTAASAGASSSSSSAGGARGVRKRQQPGSSPGPGQSASGKRRFSSTTTNNNNNNNNNNNKRKYETSSTWQNDFTDDAIASSSTSFISRGARGARRGARGRGGRGRK
jgi:hypothetical protein